METVTAGKRKTGRPIKAVKKEVRASVRFTRAEYFIVREKASKAGVTTASYLRQLAIHAQVTARLSDEERHFVRQLIGMANNINQIAKSCHQEGTLKAMIYFQAYRGLLDDLLKKLKG